MRLSNTTRQLSVVIQSCSVANVYRTARRRNLILLLLVASVTKRKFGLWEGLSQKTSNSNRDVQTYFVFHYDALVKNLETEIIVLQPSIRSYRIAVTVLSRLVHIVKFVSKYSSLASCVQIDARPLNRCINLFSLSTHLCFIDNKKHTSFSIFAFRLLPSVLLRFRSAEPIRKAIMNFVNESNNLNAARKRAEASASVKQESPYAPYIKVGDHKQSGEEWSFPLIKTSPIVCASANKVVQKRKKRQNWSKVVSTIVGRSTRCVNEITMVAIVTFFWMASLISFTSFLSIQNDNTQFFSRPNFLIFLIARRTIFLSDWWEMCSSRMNSNGHRLPLR